MAGEMAEEAIRRPVRSLLVAENSLKTQVGRSHRARTRFSRRLRKQGGRSRLHLRGEVV
jgi:hypothetical protein